jgi:hypothetical protein
MCHLCTQERMTQGTECWVQRVDTYREFIFRPWNLVKEIWQLLGWISEQWWINDSFFTSHLLHFGTRMSLVIILYLSHHYMWYSLGQIAFLFSFTGSQWRRNCVSEVVFNRSQPALELDDSGDEIFGFWADEMRARWCHFADDVREWGSWGSKLFI